MALTCVVVPTDFSTWSGRALHRVALLPLGPKAHVHLVHVAPKGNDGRKIAAGLDKLASALRDLCEARGVPKPQVHTHLRRGEPWSQIVQCARGVQADLIVLGRKGAGRGVKQVIGRTAAKVTLRCGTPTLVVGPPPRAPYARPVMAVQLDASVMAQVTLLRDVVGPGVKSALAVHAYHVPYEELIATSAESDYQRQVRADVERSVRRFLRELPPTGIRMRVRMVKDMPTAAVLRTARQEGADLICTGTHGRHGIAHAFLGSVAERVITGANRDVLVARPVHYTKD